MLARYEQAIEAASQQLAVPAGGLRQGLLRLRGDLRLGLTTPHGGHGAVCRWAGPAAYRPPADPPTPPWRDDIMIGIITSTDDVHASHVLSELRRLGSDATILDTASLPARRVGHELARERRPVASDVDAPGGTTTDLTELHAVWWRRPQAHVLHDALRGATDRAVRLRRGRRGRPRPLVVHRRHLGQRSRARPRRLAQALAAEGGGRAGTADPAHLRDDDPLTRRHFVEAEAAARSTSPSVGASRPGPRRGSSSRADLDISNTSASRR